MTVSLERKDMDRNLNVFNTVEVDNTDFRAVETAILDY